MAELKTRKTDKSVDAFIEGVDPKRQDDCRALVKLIRDLTGEPPAMWGPSIVGFGSYHYKYESGREGDWFLTGFSPRKQNLTLYIMPGFAAYASLLSKLGKHKTGKSCLYVNKLADVDLNVLKRLIAKSVSHLRRAQS